MSINIIVKIALLIGLAFSNQSIAAESPARVLYLANEGVMISKGDVKVLFDPLFDTSFGQYQLLPKQMEKELFAGLPPFDGVDAVFVSHYHGDHFSPELMLSFLKSREDIKLYAPTQAVSALHAVAGAQDQAVFERVTGIDLEHGDEPVSLTVEDLLIEAAFIPHSGWQRRPIEVKNLSFRVTLGEEITVLHMGDADPDPEHFSRNRSYWIDGEHNLALPPYWFFDSAGGRIILDEFIKSDHAIGVHVPVAMPDDPSERPDELIGFDLFTEPGESREISSTE
jgi:L-ascorbate metabolism protein UlaG (beta-lactamase superfamily)